MFINPKKIQNFQHISMYSQYRISLGCYKNYIEETKSFKLFLYTQLNDKVPEGKREELHIRKVLLCASFERKLRKKCIHSTKRMIIAVVLSVPRMYIFECYITRLVGVAVRADVFPFELRDDENVTYLSTLASCSALYELQKKSCSPIFPS